MEHFADGPPEALLPREAQHPGRPWLAGRALLLGVLTLWGLRLIFSPLSEAGGSLLHWVDLPLHEAGHVIFAPLGRFMQVLGGTLMQLLIPAVAAAALLISGRDPFGASVASWWLGQNFLDIAPYIADARAGRLPLLGGVTGRQAPSFHDWHNILGRLGWLNYDQTLAWLSFAAGVLVMLASLAWGAVCLWRQHQGRAGHQGLD